MTDEANALVELQKAAGLKTTPTPLTHDLRMAVSGEGPRAYDWQDKPHRLLYDACAEIETQAREIARLREELMQIEVDAMEYYNDWMEHGCEQVEATRFAFDLGQYARAALAGDSHDQ